MSEPAPIVKTKLFIGNLDPQTQSEELNDLFAPFGTVLEASVIKDYGFVHYGSIEEAEKAAAALNNKEFHGKRLRVELSTSTVRHRPGQPEPASALKHPRARTGGKGNSNGVSRYHSGVPSGVGAGGGPIRHNPSAWARHDAHPYDTLPYAHGAYDHAPPYDNRADPRHYYDDRREQSYPPEYDVASYGGNSGGSVGSRHYRDLPPAPPPLPGRTDSYGASRPYDRHPGMPPVDPYYGGAVPQGPPPAVDPYQNYDPYPKYYPNRARDSEYASQRDYEPYPNYRTDTYGSSGSQTMRRHESPADLRSSPALYPPSHRQQQQQQPPSYPTGSSSYAQYYGIHQR